MQCSKKGIDYEVIHGSSILSSAPAISGLQGYKFGKVTTIPFPDYNFYPKSPYEAIEENLNDIAGVRVVCSFPDDVYMLAEALLKQDDINLVTMKDYIKKPKKNNEKIPRNEKRDVLIGEITQTEWDKKTPSWTKVCDGVFSMHMYQNLRRRNQRTIYPMLVIL